MVARRGDAPRSAGCEPVALLLRYRAIEEEAPAPGNAPGFAAPAAMQLPLRVCGCALPRGAFLVENQACCYCTMRADEMAERQGLEPWTPLLVRLFSRQRPRPAGRAPFVKWLLPLASHQAHTA